MSKMTKFSIILMMFLVLALSSYAAADFSVQVTPVKDKIVIDEVAEYTITIQNSLQTDEEFTIKKAGYPFWDMFTKPLQNPITLKVPASSSASIQLFVHPLYITSVDTYTLDTGVVLSSTGEEQKVPITIGIKSTEPLIGGYIPTVLATVSIEPEKIDPRKEFTIKIVLNNQNNLNFSGLAVKAESSLFKEELNVPLGPKEEKTVEIVKKLDDMAVPQNDNLVIGVFLDKRVIVSPIIKEFSVSEYSVQESIPQEQSFLKVRKGIRVASNNPEYKGTVRIETSPLKNLFITTTPRAHTVGENGKYYLEWNVELDSGRKMEMHTTENYRPIVVVLFVIILSAVLYFVFRSPIVARKSVANIGITDGGVSGAKVVVRIKNRSPKQIANIEVIDHIPHITHVEKDLSIGSMQPSAVMQHPKKGMIIKWNIESIEAGDERVLSYRMRSRLPILGEFNLPAATARCKVGNRVIISSSNRVTIGN